MPMASVMTSTIALAPTMLVAFAMAQVQYMSADVRTSQSASATATETSLMRSANAVETVKPTSMPMAFVMTWMTVLESLTPVACATVWCGLHVRMFRHSRRRLRHNGNQLDALGICEAVAQKTLTRMAFVTMSMPVSANSIRAGCAMAPVRSTNADVQHF